MLHGWIPDPTGRAEHRWFFAGRPTSLVLTSDASGRHREAYDRYSAPDDTDPLDPAPLDTARTEAAPPDVAPADVAAGGAPQPSVDPTAELPPPGAPPQVRAGGTDGATVVVTGSGPYSAVFVRVLEDFGGLDTPQAQAVFREVRSSGRVPVPLGPDRATRLVQELTRIGASVEAHVAAGRIVRGDLPQERVSTLS